MSVGEGIGEGVKVGVTSKRGVAVGRVAGVRFAGTLAIGEEVGPSEHPARGMKRSTTPETSHAVLESATAVFPSHPSMAMIIVHCTYFRLWLKDETQCEGTRFRYTCSLQDYKSRESIGPI